MASKFIVTDPCYIVARDDRDKLHGYPQLPLIVKPNPDGRKFKIHEFGSTGGDGGVDKYNIAVDGAMLCIAEGTAKQWKAQSVGYQCDTLAQAQEVFNDAMKIMITGEDPDDEDDDRCPHCGGRL